MGQPLKDISPPQTTLSFSSKPTSPANLNYLPRRPHGRERNQLIHSGSIFTYEEGASEIKRWTDGVIWSPSRLLGNFLIYHNAFLAHFGHEIKSFSVGNTSFRRSDHQFSTTYRVSPLTTSLEHWSTSLKSDISGKKQAGMTTIVCS